MVDNGKLDTARFSEFYQKVSHELEQLESEILGLEKKYFHLTPVYENLYEKLDNLQKITQEQHASLLNYRIKNFHRELLHFHKNSGYNLDAFHDLFKHLHSIKQKLPDEIFSEPAIEVIKEKVRREAAKWIPHGLPGKSPLVKYLAVVNDTMHFIIPFKRKIWEKTVENRNKLRIQIKSMEGDNIFSFSRLPGNDEKIVKEKLAILLESDKNQKSGILADSIEGIMVFSDRFLKRKTDYFPVDGGKFVPYLTLKGKRYFIRDIFYDTSG